jgi:hypothetical protein
MTVFLAVRGEFEGDIPKTFAAAGKPDAGESGFASVHEFEGELVAIEDLDSRDQFTRDSGNAG